MSLARISLIPVIVYLIISVTNKNFIFLISIYLLAITLDFLDGFIARKLSMESELGKILDPLADKLLVLAVLITLTIKSNFPSWLAITIVIRDLVILWVSLILMKKNQKVESSILVGKVTFGIMSLLLFIFLLDLNESVNLNPIKNFLNPLCFAFLIWSWVEYFRIYMRVKT